MIDPVSGLRRQPVSCCMQLYLNCHHLPSDLADGLAEPSISW
jgi:hypothetical protein